MCLRWCGFRNDDVWNVRLIKHIKSYLYFPPKQCFKNAWFIHSKEIVCHICDIHNTKLYRASQHDIGRTIHCGSDN